MIELSPYLPGFLAAYAVLLFAALSPGPSVAMLIGIATGQGRAPALAATLGIAFGGMTINILTLLGVGLFLSKFVWAMSALRILGAAYLIYLAYCAFTRVVDTPGVQSLVQNQRTLFRHFLAGYFLQVTNPKAIAFWLVISSIGAVEGASVGTIIVFITGAFMISLVCHGAWAVTLSIDSIRMAYIAWRRWVEATLGCFFVIAAVKLVASER